MIYRVLTTTNIKARSNQPNIGSAAMRTQHSISCRKNHMNCYLIQSQTPLFMWILKSFHFHRNSKCFKTVSFYRIGLDTCQLYKITFTNRESRHSSRTNTAWFIWRFLCSISRERYFEAKNNFNFSPFRILKISIFNKSNGIHLPTSKLPKTKILEFSV